MSVIIKPIITEKSNAQAESLGKYFFVVNSNSNKISIKNAVQSEYGVTVEKVNTMNYPAIRSMKTLKSGMVHSRKGSYKKAVVKVKDGDSIDFYNNL
jgi:large subunit ribosomal protein L23